MRKVFVVLLCFVCIISQAQSTRKKSKKSITIFTVNKKTVTAEEFIYLYKKNHQNKAEDFTKDKIKEYLELFVNFKLKVEEARRRGLDTTASFIKEYNSYKDELRKPYLPDSKLIDSLVRLTYSRMKEEVRASHILITVVADAAPEDTLKAYDKIIDIRSKAISGDDFGTLASMFSEDPSAKMNKGDLGYFTGMQMVFPFETGAYTTAIGQVSNPVRTKFGYHILKVVDRRPSAGEVEVSHIMLRTGENKDNEKAKSKIFDIYDQLRAGVKWEDLCKEFSEDPGSKENGGKLRPFGVGSMAAVPAFEAVAFGLQKQGEISDPFQTQYGWHIMRLEKKIPFQSFEELAPTLKNKVARDERVQISKHALQAKLRKEYGLNENQLTKSKTLALADTTLNTGNWNAPAYPNGDKEILFSLRGKPYFVKSFLVYAEKNQQEGKQKPSKYLEQLYGNYIDACIIQMLEHNLIDQNPEYKMLLNEYYEGILLFEIMEKEVWNKASEDSTGQRKYYVQSASKYQAKERANMILYSSPSKDLITTLMSKFEQNDSSKVEEYVATQKIKKEKGRFEKEEKAILSKINWAKGIYSSDNNGTYYLAVIKEILPPGPKTFDEARASIISDYQNYLEQNWLTQLRNKYPIKINEKGKRYTFEQLQKTNSK